MPTVDTLITTASTIGVAFIAGTIAYVGLVTTKESKVSEFRQKWINDLRDEIASFSSSVDTLMEHISKDNYGISKAANLKMQSKLQHSELYNKIEHSRINIILRINVYESDKRQRVTNKLFLRKINQIASAFENFKFEKARKQIKELLPLSKTILKHEWTRTRDGEKWYQYAKASAEWIIGGSASVIMAILMTIIYVNLSALHR